MATPDLEINNRGPIDIVRHRWVYILISALFIVPGLVFIILNMVNPDIQAPVRLGIDFRGGTMLEYGFEQQMTQQDVNDIRTVFDEQGYTGAVIQIQEPLAGLTAQPADTEAGITPTPAPPPEEALTPEALSPETLGATPEVTGEGAVTLAQTDETVNSVVSIRTHQIEGEDGALIQAALQERFGNIVLLQKNSIGPSLASELMTNALLALLFAYILIVGYMTFRFQFDYAVCAIIALVHDSLFVFGVFAMLGTFFFTEINSLFVTAILTVIGFSVHDTIVVFDRIRENTRRYFTKKVSFAMIVNMSVNQTLARSINTSVTALMPLAALYFFGGETTRDFVLAMMLGIFIGTYSSICVASMLLAWWRQQGENDPKSTSTGATPATA